MAKIDRKTQKIFASSASNNGQFGSALLGTFVISNDLDTLQSLSAYDEGWDSAVVSSNDLPALEEFQALNYINTSQISYLFQEGIPEYDLGTTYYMNSIVKENGTFKIYGSLTDDNIGNALSDTANWVLLQDLQFPKGSLIDTEYITSNTTWSRPSDMTEDGYIEIMVMGAGGGGAASDAGTASGNTGGTSSFGSLISATGGDGGTANTNSQSGSGVSGGEGVSGDINVDGGTALGGIDVAGVTLGSVSGGTMLGPNVISATLFGQALSIANQPPGYGNGGRAGSIAGSVSCGGAGGGMAIKKINSIDLNFLELDSVPGGLGTDMSTGIYFNAIGASLSSGELTTIDLSTNLSNIILVNDGDLRVILNNSIYDLTSLDFTSDITISDVASTLNTALSGNVNAVDDGNTIVFSNPNPLSVNQDVTIGSGGTASIIGTSDADDGNDGIIIIKSFR